jgi:hypothetical protein
MGFFGTDHNVDWNRLDSQQSHIYREGKSDGLELAAKIAEKFSDQGRDGHQIAKAIRALGQGAKE